MRSRFSCGLKCLCLDGSDPLNELWSFSSCPFMGRELGDGGKSSAGQPNHIFITEEVTHKCACVFLQPTAPCGWSCHQRLENQWKKRMKVMCWKVRSWLGEVRCLLLMRMETEEVQDTSWDVKLMVVQSVVLSPPNGSCLWCGRDHCKKIVGVRIQDCHELALHQCRFQVRRRNCQP